MQSSEWRRRTVAAASGFLLCATGCDGCGREKPYTPFGVASTLPNPLSSSSASAPPSAESSAEPPRFAAKHAELAPHGATRFTLDNRELTAPTGRVFALGLSAELDGDDAPDAVAWTLPVGAVGGTGDAGSSGNGELWFFPGKGAARRLLTQPAFLPAGPGCRFATDLAETGEHSVTLDILASCDTQLMPRAPVRAIVVLRPAAEKPVIVTLRAAAAAAGESLRFAVESTDRDHDGLDDVRLTATMQADGSARPASADFAWLDRAAGPSRDATEPSRSLARLAGAEAARAKSKAAQKTIGDGIANVRRLYAAICSESATARLLDAEGTPLACGNLKGFVDDLASAELNAALTRKDFVEAAAVLGRDGFYHAKMSNERRDKLEHAFDAAVPHVDVARVRELSAKPPPRGNAPRWSPLYFAPDGRLVVESKSGLVGVERDGNERELGTDTALTAWPLEVIGPDGAHFMGIQHSCDRSEIVLQFSATGGATLPARPTRVLAARPGPCRGATPPKTAISAPISWPASGLEALVAGSIVGPPNAAAEAALKPSRPGTPRSPDGRTIVVTTSRGLLIAGRDSAERWQGATLGEPLTLEDCVVDDGHTRVACVRDGRALLIEPAAKAPAP